MKKKAVKRSEMKTRRTNKQKLPFTDIGVFTVKSMDDPVWGEVKQVLVTDAMQDQASYVQGFICAGENIYVLSGKPMTRGEAWKIALREQARLTVLENKLAVTA